MTLVSLPICARLAALLLRGAEGGWLRPQAERELHKAAQNGDLATLKRLVEKGVNIEKRDGVSATAPVPPAPSASDPPPSPPATPAAPPSPSPLTACGAAAAPPQGGGQALMFAAQNGKLDCVEHLIGKGAKLNPQTTGVRRGPATAWRRGVWG